jgi:hypothetical protein
VGITVQTGPKRLKSASKDLILLYVVILTMAGMVIQAVSAVRYSDKLTIGAEFLT